MGSLHFGWEKGMTRRNKKQHWENTASNQVEIGDSEEVVPVWARAQEMQALQRQNKSAALQFATDLFLFRCRALKCLVENMQEAILTFLYSFSWFFSPHCVSGELQGRRQAGSPAGIRCSRRWDSWPAVWGAWACLDASAVPAEPSLGLKTLALPLSMDMPGNLQAIATTVGPRDSIPKLSRGTW